MESRGIAPRSTQCHCVVLLLDDGPEMERAPGLAPGKSGFASRRLDDFGIRECFGFGFRGNGHEQPPTFENTTIRHSNCMHII